MKIKLLFLAFSVVLSLFLVYFAYFVKIESLIIFTNITVVVLAILNTLASILEIIGTFQSLLTPKSTQSIGYKLGSEILTPLYVDMKKIKGHLESFHLTRINVELWRKKTEEYLFLKIKQKTREFINNFYGRVEEYNSLQGRFKALVQMKISSEIYRYCEGIVVPPVERETGYGFDEKFNSFCRETTQKICDSVVTIVLSRKSFSSLQPRDLGILESPLFNLLRRESGFSFTVRSEDPDVIDENAAKYSEKFAKSVFESIFKENLLREIKGRRTKLIEQAGELVKVLDSEIKKTS